MATIINMVNSIDGLDGLAAGVCAISALTFAAIAVSLGRGATGRGRHLASAALAFLRFNFYPASTSWATRARCCSATSSP